MEMQKIKFVPAQMELVQHGQVSGKVRLQQRRIKPDGLIAHGNQRRAGIGFRAREQRDLMAQLHKRVAQVRDDAFGAAIQFRRHRLVEGRDLSDFHGDAKSRRQGDLARIELNIIAAKRILQAGEKTSIGYRPVGPARYPVETSHECARAVLQVPLLPKGLVVLKPQKLRKQRWKKLTCSCEQMEGC
jgi:hypothetical protein